MPLPSRALTLVVACGALLCGPALGDELGEVRALITAGNLCAALARVKKAVQADPRDAQARFLRGVVLMDLRRDAEAMAVFVGLSQEFPELPDPYNNIAVLDVRADRLEQAELALQTALRNDPSHRLARVNLGQVHLMLAVKAWEAAAASGPDDRALQRKVEAARAVLAEPMLAAR